MPDLTVCLLNWRRPDNLRRIIDALARQTARPAVFLWNNSGQPFRHDGIDCWIHNSRNSGCWPRWLLATQAETDFVASLDDDLMPADPHLDRNPPFTHASGLTESVSRDILRDTYPDAGSRSSIGAIV